MWRSKNPGNINREAVESSGIEDHLHIITHVSSDASISQPGQNYSGISMDGRMGLLLSHIPGEQG